MSPPRQKLRRSIKDRDLQLLLYLYELGQPLILSRRDSAGTVLGLDPHPEKAARSIRNLHTVGFLDIQPTGRASTVGRSHEVMAYVITDMGRRAVEWLRKRELLEGKLPTNTEYPRIVATAWRHPSMTGRVVYALADASDLSQGFSADKKPWMDWVPSTPEEEKSYASMPPTFAVAQ